MLVRDYLEAGFVLVPIPLGSKGPTKTGWQKREACYSDPTRAHQLTANIGLAHAYSGTCAIDIDDVERASAWLAERGVMLGALLDEPESVRISSGRPNRAKLIYRLPEPLASKKIIEAKQNIIDFRCASASGTTAQDVLPPSVHPDTGQPYVWEYGDELVGDWRAIPVIPESLLAIWKGLLSEAAPVGEATEPTVTFEELRELLKDLDPGCDRDTWVKTLAMIHHETRGSDEGLALADEWSQGSDKYKGLKDVKTRWRSYHLNHAAPVTAASFRVDKPASLDEFEVVAETPSAAPVTQRPALPGFKRDKQGRIEATVGNVLMALRATAAFDIQIQRDTFRDEVMLTRGAECRPLKDADYVRIREELERRSFRPIGRELMRDAVLEVADTNQFDSAQTWLQSLVWDGVPRIDRLLESHFGVKPSPYATAVSRYLMTALAGRVMQPGCKADMVPVLLGPQGCGKTRAVEALAPQPDLETKIDLTERDDNLARMMRGQLIGEIAELKGLQAREAGSIKAFLSRSHDSWVPKYIEHATHYPRRIVFIGTTNEDEFLADETGNRRWLPVRVGMVDVPGIGAIREQLWAEAALVWSVEGIAYTQAETLAIAEHDQYIVSDPWEDAIEYWLRGVEGRKQRRAERPFTLSEVAIGALQMDIKTCGKSQEMRIARVLTKLGLVRITKRVNGTPKKVWGYHLSPPAIS